MLLTLMSNLNMFGGTVPPIVVDRGGGSYEKKYVEDQYKKRMDRLIRDDEEVFNFIKTFVRCLE